MWCDGIQGELGRAIDHSPFLFTNYKEGFNKSIKQVLNNYETSTFQK